MERHRSKLRYGTIVLFCFLNLGFGLYAGQVPMLVAGGIGLVYVTWAVFGGRGSPTTADAQLS
jgi:hypothetical protein